MLAIALAACGGPANSAPPPPRPAATSSAVDYPSGDAGWGKFHSKRFQLTIPLPDGHAWKIDDHQNAELVATHPATDARLRVLLTQEEELMNRERCEDRARELGWVPEPRPKRRRNADLAPPPESLTTVEDKIETGPDAYDSRIWVALDPGNGEGPVVGHVFLFGAFLRRCLLVDYSTRVPSPKDEGILASRLATAGARIVRGITIDAPRTTDSATIPRDKPPTPR
jgi:hypothetical protein